MLEAKHGAVVAPVPEAMPRSSALALLPGMPRRRAGRGAGTLPGDRRGVPGLPCPTEGTPEVTAALDTSARDPAPGEA